MEGPKQWVLHYLRIVIDISPGADASNEQMEPDLWTAFVFFGIPLALGLLGVHFSGRRLYRTHRTRSSAVDTEYPMDERATEQSLSRTQLLQTGLLLVVSLLLVAHSGRWLLTIFGVL